MSDANTINTELKEPVMNQLPDASILGQSPLHHADLSKLAEHGRKIGGVFLKEKAMLGHLTLRCNSSSKKQMKVVEQIMGAALPVKPLTSVKTSENVMLWISPDEWLMLVPGLEAFNIETQFRENMPGHYSLVNSSGGSTVIELSGEHAVDVLKKSTAIDFHSLEFPVGKVVSTVFAKSTATIRRIEEQAFELVVRRSFADYIWCWLQDASREYGLVIKA